MSAPLSAGTRLREWVKSLAEDYSDFNAYITYIYRVYSGREDSEGIKVRSSLITIRSFFISCVENLATVMTRAQRAPYPSLLAEVKMYASTVKPQVEAITREYDTLSKVANQEGVKEVVVQLGSIVGDINRLFDELKTLQ
ncbi:MAG: hypothetical protein QW514_04580 [Thermoprotei archaeon]